MEALASSEEQSFAKLQIDRLRQGKFEDIEHIVDPSIKGPNARGNLVKMAAIFPSGEPTSLKLVGVNQMTMPGTKTTNLTFEYEFPGKWLLTNVLFKQQGDKTTIVGFNVYPQSASIASQFKFTLSNKTPLHYAFLALTIFMPLFTLFALVLCIRTKFIGWKWPWIIFILVGFSKVSLNWATGDWMWSPFSIMLMSAGFMALGNGPWVLSVAVPYGAIAFLLCRPTLKVPSGNQPVRRDSSSASGPLDYSNILDDPSPRGA
jgi:hypothetical protein